MKYSFSLHKKMLYFLTCNNDALRIMLIPSWRLAAMVVAKWRWFVLRDNLSKINQRKTAYCILASQCTTFTQLRGKSTWLSTRCVCLCAVCEGTVSRRRWERARSPQIILQTHTRQTRTLQHPRVCLGDRCGGMMSTVCGMRGSAGPGDDERRKWVSMDEWRGRWRARKMDRGEKWHKGGKEEQEGVLLDYCRWLVHSWDRHHAPWCNTVTQWSWG